MGYKFEEELRERAERFIEALADVGISGSILPGSFRDYMVKVSVQRHGQGFGNAILYYSPKKDQFSLKTHELSDKSIVPHLEACWDRLSLPGAAADHKPDAATGYQAYTDGSCLEGAIGYGVVILKDGNPVAQLSGPVEEEGLQGMRQVGGEVQAIYEAIGWCQQNGAEAAAVFYDYAGLEKWATGEWQAKNPATRAYAEFMRECPISISWQKVESHSGDRWNDQADQLAKQGARQKAGQEEEVGQDPLAVVRENAGGFVEFLGERGIVAAFDGIINDQYGRVIIGSREGYVDVYNTGKRPVSDPYLHCFHDQSLKDQVAALYRDFLSGSGKETARKDSLSAVSHYYRILEPYRDCEFDFILLARALQTACGQVGHQAVDAEALRLDFEKLEAIYLDLKEENRG